MKIKFHSFPIDGHEVGNICLAHGPHVKLNTTCVLVLQKLELVRDNTNGSQLSFP